MQKQIEKIYSRPARPGMVGDGFRVFNYFPNAELTQQRVSPFLMMDFNAEYDFGASDHIRGVDGCAFLSRASISCNHATSTWSCRSHGRFIR